MSTLDEIEHLHTLLTYHRRTLVGYLERRAALGGTAHVPPEVRHGIGEMRSQIKGIKNYLATLGAAVADEFCDDDTLEQEAARAHRYDTPLGSRKLLDHIGEGMGALRLLTEQAPQIHDATVTFRALFKGAREQITELRAYKSLHDSLHNLQLLCYENIEQELQRFPDDDLAAENLAQYAINLEEIIASMHEATAEAASLTSASHWITRLDTAYGDIQQALATQNAALLHRATMQIRRVLSLHPVQINARLQSIVGSIRLAELLAEMATIHAVCLTLDVDATLIARLNTSVQALEALHQRLLVLIQDHDGWQQIDNLIRTLDGYSDQDDMREMWPELKAQAGRLCSASDEQWAVALQTNTEQLDHALAVGDMSRLKPLFVSYRSRVVRRFYRVDSKLKELCDKLNSIDGPFAAMLGVLE